MGDGLGSILFGGSSSGGIVGCSKTEADRPAVKPAGDKRLNPPVGNVPATGGEEMVEGAGCPCPKVVPSKNGLYQGAFVGDVVTEETVAGFEKISGQSLDIALKFLAFATGLQFPTREAEIIGKNGGTLFIKLETWSWKGKDDQSFSLDNLLVGKYDSYLAKFAEGAKRFGKPVFVSFDHEMNGNWYPWSGDPEKYVKAYRYVHEKLSKEFGACNITWVWNPNIDFGNLNAFYPGDDYVDWVAADGYNTVDYGGAWRSCEQLFDGVNAELEKFGNPIMVGEFASDANSPQDQKVNKPQWLGQCIDHLAADKRIKAYIYFNQDKVEGEAKEWAIDTPEAIKAYSAAIARYAAIFVQSIQTTCGEIAKTTVVVDKPVEKAPIQTPVVASLKISDIMTGTFTFKGGELAKSGSSFIFKANKANDAGAVIQTGDTDVSAYKTLKFEIKGEVTKLGGWARLAVQIYDQSAGDAAPSVMLDPVELGQDFQTVTVNLEGQVKLAKKIQFILVSDKGSIKVEIKDLRFE